MAAFAANNASGNSSDWVGAVEDTGDFGVLAPDVSDMLEHLRAKKRRTGRGTAEEEEEDKEDGGEEEAKEAKEKDLEKNRWLDDVTINKAERDWAKAANALEGQLMKNRKSMQDCIADFQASPVRAA
eukprot:2974594-Alexandrium_andersonii.AAC.1